MARESENPQSSWLTFFSQRQREIAYTMFGIGAALVVGSVLLISKYRWEVALEVIACLAFSFVLFFVGYWHLWREPEDLSDPDASRILVLIVGGFLGFLISLVAVGRAIIWIDYFKGGLEKWQGEGAWRIWVCIGAELAGLAIMFISLQLARTEERSNPVLRRLLYGYNAGLTGLLLLAILVVANILAYVYVPLVSDWTKSGIYSLDPDSKRFLEHLEKPVKVYAMLAYGDQFSEVRNLLDNCQAVTNKISVEYYSFHQDQARITELIQRYQLVAEPGLLVVYGEEGQESHHFIKAEGELFDFGRMGPNDKPKFDFKGEDALITAIDFLSQGKSKAVVYFTQSNGELDINSFNTSQPDVGAGLLKERLQKANYDVKGLKLNSLAASSDTDKQTIFSDKVPDDAVAVVVAGPRTPFSQDTLKAFRQYLNPIDPKKKKGSLIVMLDVVIENGNMVHTGLESFLAGFNVEIGNDRIMTAKYRDIVSGGSVKRVAVAPTEIRVATNSQSRTSNPVVAVFEGKIISMRDIRTVRPKRLEMANSRGSLYQADVLLQTAEPGGVWTEEDFQVDPVQLVTDYLNNRLEDLKKKISREELPVAVAVTESDPNVSPGQRTQVSKPRLVVFGDASFASNQAIGGGSFTGGTYLNYSLIASTLAWLRERPGNIGIKAKSREVYAMEPNTNISRMINMPFFLMTFGVLGLGLGIWVVRRR